MADPHHDHLRLRSARPLFRQTSLPYSSGEPVKHILAAESRAEMAKGRNAKVRLHCEQPACRRCRLISPSRVRQRGRLKYIKGAEARIRLDGFGEKRDGLVQSSGETAHHPESIEGHEALRIEGTETQSPRRVIFGQRGVAAIRGGLPAEEKRDRAGWVKVKRTLDRARRRLKIMSDHRQRHARASTRRRIVRSRS